MYKVYTGYCGTSEIEYGLCACTVDNPLAKARGLSLRTGVQTMLYLSHKRLKTEHLFIVPKLINFILKAIHCLATCCSNFVWQIVPFRNNRLREASKPKTGFTPRFDQFITMFLIPQK